MSVEKERADIQKRIIEIDRQMSVEFEQKMGRIPRRLEARRFPLGTLMITAVIVGWIFYGDGLMPDFHARSLQLIQILGILAVVASALLLVLWLWDIITAKGRQVVLPDMKDTDTTRKLREQKEALQKRLEELKKL